MPWLKVYDDLPRHPKTTRLTRKLNVDRALVVGCLVCLWTWAFEYAEDGDLSKYEAEDIAEAARWPGDAAEFVAALHATGWLDKGPLIHDWEAYTSAYFKDLWRHRKSPQNGHYSEEVPRNLPRTSSHENKKESKKEKDLPVVKSEVLESQELEVLTGEVVELERDDPFEDLFWPAWPNKHGSKKTAKARFATASKVQQKRILIAEGFLIATIADGRYEMQYLPRAENFVGGQKSYYEEWAEGPPAKYCRGNGNGSKKQREIDDSIERAINSVEWPEEES
jgi:hypothetical protein